MKAHEYAKMLDAARDIVARADSTPHQELDPFTTQWARDLVALNPGVRPHKTPAQDAIYAVWADDHNKAMLLGDIRSALPEMDNKVLSATVHHMVKNSKRLFALVKPQKTRYFASAAARDLGREQFDVDMQALERRKALLPARINKPPKPPPAPKTDKPQPEPKQPKPPKEPKVPKPKPQKEKKKALTPSVTIKPRTMNAGNGEVVIPDHVKVQHCPSSNDTRYTVTEPITDPDSFGAEWKRLRGETP